MQFNKAHEKAQHEQYRLLTFLALTCVLLLTNTIAHASDIQFQRFLTDQFSAEKDVGSIVTIAADNNGFIWIGGEYGLARFDGQNTKRYSVIGNSDAVTDSTYINDIKVASDNTMWVGTERGLSYLDKDDTFTLIQPFPNHNNLNRIASITEDKKNQIVLARPNGISIYDPKRKLFKHFELPNQLQVPVVAVYVDAQNNIWLGTHGAGAAKFDRLSHRFTFYQHDSKDTGSLGGNHVTKITQDHQGRTWIGTKNAGISRLAPGARKFVHFAFEANNPRTLQHNYIRDIFVDSQQWVWVTTDHGGLARYNESTNDFDLYRHNTYDLTTLASNQMRTIVEDKRGDLWVGSFPSGLNYFNRATAQFQNFKHRPDNPNSLSHSAILCFLEDSDGQVWIGTEEGLNLFNESTGHFKRYMPSMGQKNALQAGAVVALEEDPHNNIWVGTWSGGLHRFNKKTETFIHYSPTDEKGSLQSPFIWSIISDKKGRLWVGTEGAGLGRFNPETNTFTHFMESPTANSINHNDVWSMLEDHKGQLWIGTTAGLNRFNPETLEFYNFPRVPNDPYTINSERIRAIYQDSKQRIWIGTQEAGLFIYDFNTERFQHLTTKDGLPAAYVTGFIEDNDGFIWTTTTSGAIKINPKTLAMTVMNKNHGLVSDNFYRPAQYKNSEGLLYLGSADGFSVFDPQKVSQYPADSTVHFTGIRTPVRQHKNQPATPPRIETVNGKNIVTLSYLDSVFSIEFSSLDFRSGDNKRYKYRLKGFTKNWTEVKNQNLITYTNLNPGKYVFNVQAGTLAGWNTNSSDLYITVTPPPWKTWWAYTLYFILASGLIYLVVHTKIKQLQLTGEREVNSQLRALNIMKDAFLANTSHELRTPLNGIIGIAETLKDRTINRDAYTERNLQLIISSGKRLAALINDILDYSKLTNDTLDLYTQPVDIYALVQNVFVLLTPLTRGKKIILVNDIQHLAPFVQADENRLQQILINLIGNGIKYTAEGSVTVDFNIKEETAYIYIKDTGVGIPQDKQSEIFEVFNQLQNDDAREYDGTGLGLAITRQLVELHGGEIWVESNEEKGSTFIFSLPAANEEDSKFRPIPKTKEDSKKHEVQPEIITAPPGNTPMNEPRNAKDQTILIVDDDSVNRMVLEGMLNIHHYNTVEADSGAAAIEIVKNNPSIDLIIMDVMMPNMTGFEACAEIRKTHEIQDLPIVFLTAKSGDDNMKQGFDAGGNDFLTKPVNKNDLLPRVANHLRIQAAVRKLQLRLLDE